MTTLDIRLVPARPEHVDVWMAMREEPVSRRLLPLEPATRESFPKATSFRWMVELDGRIIGTVAARGLSRFQGRVEIGYMLSSAYQGRGLGTRAVAMVLERLFEWPFLIEGQRKDAGPSPPTCRGEPGKTLTPTLSQTAEGACGVTTSSPAPSPRGRPSPRCPR